MKEKLKIILYYMLTPLLTSLMFFLCWWYSSPQIPIYIQFLFMLPHVFLLYLLALKLLYTRITDNLIYGRFSHKISQKYSVKKFIQINFKNNFKNGKVYYHKPKSTSGSRCHTGYSSYNKQLITFFKHTKLKEFTTETNEKMYNRLHRIEKLGIISIKPLNKNPIQKSQTFEKLSYVGLTTAIVNINNKEFWNYINQIESINKYKIIVN